MLWPSAWHGTGTQWPRPRQPPDGLPRSRAASWLIRDDVEPVADLVNTACVGETPQFVDRVGTFHIDVEAFRKNTDVRCQIAFLTPEVKVGIGMTDTHFRWSPFQRPQRHLRVVRQGRPPLTLLTALGADLAVECNREPGIEPTNNLAEQAIRFVASHRRLSQGATSGMYGHSGAQYL